MSKVQLSLAISDYDHVRDFITGRVSAEGIEITPLQFSVEEIFYRFIVYREWDVSELSFAKYAGLRSQGDTSITAIPVFPSRMFRHSSIYIRKGGPIATPADLRGARIGVPEWSQTAAVYSRGALVHQYGIGLHEVKWFQSGVNQPGRSEKLTLNLPAGVEITRVTDRSLDEMLQAGDIDAMLSAHAPQSFEEGNPAVVRLFSNYREIEEQYYRDTKVFPIMHVIAIRTEVLERNPWVAMNLFTAFEAAKRRSVARAIEVTASRFPLPWASARVEEAQALFGKDYMPYGVEPNRPTLEAFTQWAFEQGVCARKLTPEELFAPTTSTQFKL